MSADIAILLARVAFADEERDVIDLEYSAHTREGKIFERPECRVALSRLRVTVLSSAPS